MNSVQNIFLYINNYKLEDSEKFWCFVMQIQWGKNISVEIMNRNVSLTRMIVYTSHYPHSMGWSILRKVGTVGFSQNFLFLCACVRARVRVWHMHTKWMCKWYKKVICEWQAKILCQTQTRTLRNNSQLNTTLPVMDLIWHIHTMH
jgi:hypothetical protein